MSTFANALKKVKKDEPKTSRKSSMPLLENGSKDVKNAVDNLVAAKERIKKDTAIVSKSEVVIDDFVKPIQDENGFNMTHSKSYEVAGNNETIKRVTQDRFTVSNDDEENLVELFGQDGFDERFEKDKSLTAVSDIFSDENLQKEVMKKLGDKLFARLFVYKEKLKTKKGYDVLQYKEKEKLEDSRIFVKQYKASFKM